MRILTLTAITLAALVIGGCSTVKPWDRDLLSQKKMQLVPAPVDNALDEHVYFSKEAASGGQSIGGGGCGCN
jgi:hypothetical protein